jgi:hypothetical protein
MGLTAPSRQVAAEQLVVPDPERLDVTAEAELTQERTEKGLGADLPDPAVPADPARAAVYLTSQARLVAQGSTTCADCAPAPASVNEPGQLPPDDENPPPDEEKPPPPHEELDP